MTIRECYEILQGDYEDIYSRLEEEDEVLYFMQMFLNDESYQKMLIAIKEADARTARMQAHTFKGVCVNLAFTKLTEIIMEISERLYSGEKAQAMELLPVLDEEYTRTLSCLQEFMNNQR